MIVMRDRDKVAPREAGSTESYGSAMKTQPPRVGGAKQTGSPRGDCSVCKNRRNKRWSPGTMAVAPIQNNESLPACREPETMLGSGIH